MNHIQLTPPAKKPPIKALLLHHFYQGGTLNRFEAIEQFNYKSLAEAISKFRAIHFLEFSRQSEFSRCQNNMTTICPRYWLTNNTENLEAAYHVLVHEFGYTPSFKPAA
ncbi:MULTISPECIES: hypothetical protein [unclassified Pseudoalteromonas]|jgi:hypothetical protein|uniref:hypothetical protein n=1 Tax=unclassified Pseudoalteromonas TaxID=194690 RepID=UPI000428BA31|nr:MULTISPECIES: hypothetical protein [unclassified Pseudoalteromonas]MBB1455214.1 hypothetical protein [Pseudoalteromonas sp. SG43-5]MDC9497267.1 hypothetical protein [Pseudoalteromonas sp. Angola-20]MDC9517720.1 hypothetical protein [Pseudoalteromonas sp. Angola-22]MDC9534011.1 hypothetical protein [Pseudoalteromonas sp. Angola-9]TMP82115.1 hypothetical protein CWB71_10135 [Pseudoalteromonas sp. S983]